MRLLFRFFALAGLVFGWIIGYQIMIKVLPDYLPMWWIAQVFVVLGICGNEFAKD